MEEFKTNLGKVGCHTINVGELFVQLDTQFGSEEEGKVKIPVEKLPEVLGITWGKLKETFLECEGKELVVDFGDTPGANAFESLFKFLLEILPNSQKTAKA